MRRLNLKIAVATGGANGVGQALAKRFPVDGAAVPVADCKDHAEARKAVAVAGASLSSATRGVVGPRRVPPFAGGVPEKLAHREAERALQQSIALASTRRADITW